jgi:hypothetical protein
MTKSTFRGTNTPPWKDQGKGAKDTNPSMGDSKFPYSSTGPEREMRREMTHSEGAARAKHIATDTKQHPMFNNRRPDTRGRWRGERSAQSMGSPLTCLIARAGYCYHAERMRYAVQCPVVYSRRVGDRARYAGESLLP